MAETARQILLRKAQEILEEERLLKAIATEGTPTENGYLIPAELIERLRQMLFARD